VKTDPLLDLARSVIDGDRRALRTFLVTVSPHLLRVVRKVLGASHLDVDDVAQEAAYAVIEALPRHRGECSVLHFACRVAVLTAMNARRREATRKRASRREAGAEIELFPSDAVAPEEAAIAKVRAQAVRELFDTLPPEQAEVLAMHCVLGYTVREISDASRTPIETLRSRLRLAKQALRDRIAADPELRKIVGES
jgi:RNA polymerase sigma-70 factor (ECF subfamily)